MRIARIKIKSQQTEIKNTLRNLRSREVLSKETL